MTRRLRRPSRHERHNREFWDADADDYQAAHGAALRAEPEAWGVWRIPESELRVLGSVEGLDVLEFGCGAAQWSIALAGRGARVVGLDQSINQLVHAAAGAPAAGTSLPLLCASGEHVPCADTSFDVVFCDHGALSFCDPRVALPEVARVLRPGGRLVFCHSTIWRYLTYGRRTDRETRRLRRTYFGRRLWAEDEGTFDFALPTGDWVRAFRAAGLAVDDLIELRAPKRARTTYGWDDRWARRWPAEEIWVLRKA
ncbi:MAG: methyltransferase domain-containing protein [Acidimicrobiia bacterium]